jgi:hypothetical protein
MERFIAGLVKDFESGKLDRREFCKTVALAAAVYGAGDAANAESGSGLKMIGINHISYDCRTMRRRATGTTPCSAWRARRGRTAASGRT